jgi:DNA primase
MARITQSTIDRIFETARIEEVIGEFVQLKRSGSNLKGLSPFNNEKTPSFMVSPAKQIFKDFSSGKGGTAVTFLMEHEHFTYPEALRWLAKKYNIEIEEDAQQTPEQKEAENERESVYLITKFAQEWYAEQLGGEEGKQIGLSYFRERGFSDEIIETFGLGYSPQLRDAFARAALEKQYNEKYLIDSGICIKRDNGQWYDRFWGRVIFPIYSAGGRVLGFGGRVLKSDAKAAKYLNSPENPIYHKSRVLYGLFQARKAIVKQDEAFLVEGYTDVISLYQAGIENVVASSGTALTEDQIRLLKRYTNNVTILYDGDPAGIRASFRGIDMFLQEGVNVRVVLFPDGDDPDSFVRKTSGIEFKEFVAEHKTDFIRFKADLLMQDTTGDPIRQAEVIRDMVTSIAKIPDEISRDVFVKETARILDMDVAVLYGELNQIKGKELREAQRKGARPKMEVVQQPPANKSVETAKNALHYEQELEVIKLLVNHGNEQISLKEEAKEDEETEETSFTIAQFLVAGLLEDDLGFKNPRFQRVFDECVERLMKNEPVPDTDWYTRQEDPQLATLPSDLMEPNTLSEKWKVRGITVITPKDRLNQHSQEALLRFKDSKLKSRIDELREQLKKVAEENTRQALVNEFTELNKIRLVVSKKLNRVV